MARQAKKRTPHQRTASAKRGWQTRRRGGSRAVAKAAGKSGGAAFASGMAVNHMAYKSSGKRVTNPLVFGAIGAGIGAGREIHYQRRTAKR